MALSVVQADGPLRIAGAVVIGTIGADGTFQQYVGPSYKSPVRVATTVAGTLATSFENGDTVDGIVLATGDRLLIKNQVSAPTNGIYIVAATGAPTRASDFNEWSEIPGAVVGVLEGTTNADTAWLCTSNSGGTLGVTDINFSAFGASVDLHSPGPIGDVTPSTIAGTTITGNAANALGNIVIGGLPADPTNYGGVWIGQATPSTVNYTILASSGLGQIFFNSGMEGYFRVLNNIIVKYTATDVILESGVALQLGNSATSAGAAGALAALTTQSIEFKDSNGDIKLVPCMPKP